MIEFEYPYLFILLLLPIPIRMVSSYYQRSDSVYVPFFSRIQELSGEKLRHGAMVRERTRLQQLLLPIAWLALVTAAAQPVLYGDPITQTKSARDLMVAVDLSGSMETKDFVSNDGKQMNRLDALKLVLSSFSKEREHDRLGLILFGDAPYLQVPFTEDHEVWLTLLNETVIGMAGQSTVIGDSVGLGIKLFKESDLEEKVLIVLTDGNDTGSKVPPVDAAKIAANYGIKIYTVAIGDPENSGEESIDEETLKRMADLTGGAYYRAYNSEELSDIYASISALEPDKYETLSYRPKTMLHYYPIIVITLIYLVYFILSVMITKQKGRVL